MGLPVEVNNLMLGSLGGYTVGRSLRFRSSASAYLNRTPSASNRQTWTWSGWVKRGTIGTAQQLFGAYIGSGTTDTNYFEISYNSDQLQITGYSTVYRKTTQVFRDPSAWYHVIVALDTTQATASNRVKLYINGVQVTAFATSNDPALNSNLGINGNYPHGISAIPSNAAYFDGYLAEVNFIDGQALTPSSFGAYDTNGVWQPKKYSGTYGTNGFYLPFSNTTSTTTLVADSSGNGNNWTPNNISLTAGTTYDSMIDSPTNSASSSNYCVFNPVSNLSASITDANLSAAISDASGNMGQGTFGMSSGKWYWEATMSSTRFLGGIRNVNNAPVSTTSVDPHFAAGTGAYGFGTGTDIGTNYDYYNASTPTRVATTMQATTGVVVQFAFDADNGKLWLGLNGTWQSSGNPSAGTGNLVSPPTGNTYVPMLGLGSSSLYGVYANFGQRPFSYTPPSGFKALNTYNLPAPSIANGAQYMAATTYTGTGATQNINNAVNGVSSQPDFVWIKTRSVSSGHVLIDSVRGTTAYLNSNTTNAENTSTDQFTSFNSNGFTLGANALTGGNTNASGTTYVGWQWKGGGTGVTNNSGTITSTVSANPSAGFSIVTYTGNGTQPSTVGHGLGVAPSFIITKRRNTGATDWNCWFTGFANNDYIVLNSTVAKSSDPNTFPSAAGMTSSVFTIGNGAWINGSGNTYVAYCFAAVKGYSAFGSYTGNGSTDGPFVFTNMRPRWLMIKRTDSAEGWHIHDTSRNTYNPAGTRLQAESSGADDNTQSTTPDILSNGFKIRSSWAGENASGGTYVYACFSENPFSLSRAR